MSSKGRMQNFILTIMDLLNHLISDTVNDNYLHLRTIERNNGVKFRWYGPVYS